ncbi:SurA N-terminal domain-containing protein [Clostridium sp. BNL1100]|uniref:SurA N-terminal domain-containing protein n=1 Tax=Clostridium sp. BNL1100 TaxID=755731 RepID=UPI0009FEB4D4|nr:SurA N-terminal domain-containing protein [Clostridium sp. BNL1100]
MVATINGEKITKKGFDTYKVMINSENKLSDKEILDKIVESHVVYMQAVKEGFHVSDQQVEAAIKSAQEAIKMDSKQYEAFKEYLSGLKISENEYWESVKPAYKKALIRGAYNNALKQKFNKAKIENNNEHNSKFSEFYKQKIKDLKSKTKAESFLK